MKHPLLYLALLPLALWGIFALPDILAAAPEGFWAWRKSLIVLSGTLALWWMSAGMLLATRPVWLENRFGGLDKLYRLHKHIGIGAGILVFAHWMFEWLPKNLAKAGLIVGPNRPRGPRGEPEMWIDLAKEVGEWAGYILLALVVLALLKRIPYHGFRLVHKAFGLVFLGGAFHGLMLMPDNFWATPLGWLTATVAVAGVLAAILSLGNRIGRQRRFSAIVEAVRQNENQVLEIVCRPQPGWPGHAAGQFLFADFGVPREGAHPFTIASAWEAQQGTLTLAVKALGDFTRCLPGLLQAGRQIGIEGPYGRFAFADGRESHQIWIAGGIGITPFIARLQDLARLGLQADVDFFYSTTDDNGFPRQLDTLCAQTGVRLHRRLSQRDGPFAGEDIAAAGQSGSTVWFCGPRGWGDALHSLFSRRGLPDARFHREAFEFR